MIYKAMGEFLTHQTQEELFYVGMLETDPKGFFTDKCFGNKFTVLHHEELCDISANHL